MPVPIISKLLASNTLKGLKADFAALTGKDDNESENARSGRRQAIKQYLEAHSLKKLQLGAGFNPLPGWLSSDIEPTSEDMIFLDATKPFPLGDEVMDYILSEHMVEHLTYNSGRKMLKECYRVLKPGGVLRIATPDLAVLLNLYSDNKSPEAQHYIKWITDENIPSAKSYKASFVINNAFRNWGHTFLYDRELLLEILDEAGFSDIKEYMPNESDNAELKGLEHHGKFIQSEVINNYETMVFEVVKPLKTTND